MLACSGLAGDGICEESGDVGGLLHEDLDRFLKENLRVKRVKRVKPLEIEPADRVRIQIKVRVRVGVRVRWRRGQGRGGRGLS